MSENFRCSADRAFTNPDTSAKWERESKLGVNLARVVPDGAQQPYRNPFSGGGVAWHVYFKFCILLVCSAGVYWPCNAISFYRSCRCLWLLELRGIR